MFQNGYSAKMQTVEKTVSLTPFNIFTLILLVSFPAVGAISIAAALPTIAASLNLTKQASQLLISFYMIGFAIGPLIFAPFSNHFGRKPLLLICLSIASLSSLGCLAGSFVNSFTLMLAARIIMALAASGCLKLCWDIAADILQGSALTRMSSLFTLSFSLAPAFSIVIGGFLTQYLGWKSIFLFLILYSFLLLSMSLTLPETVKTKEKSALSFKTITQKYHQAFSNRLLMFGSVLLGITTSAVYLFGTNAPFIAEIYLKLSPAVFGLFALLTCSGMFMGGICGALLAKRLSTITIFFLGAFIFIFGAVILALLFFEKQFNPWAVFSTFGLIFFGTSLAFSSMASLALSAAKDKSYASSMMNGVNLSITVIVILSMGPLSLKYHILFPVIYLLLAFLTCILGLVLKKMIEHPHEPT